MALQHLTRVKKNNKVIPYFRGVSFIHAVESWKKKENVTQINLIVQLTKIFILNANHFERKKWLASTTDCL